MDKYEKMLKKARKMLRLARVWVVLLVVLPLLNIFGRTIIESDKIRFVISLILLITCLIISIIQLVNISRMKKETKKIISEIK